VAAHAQAQGMTGSRKAAIFLAALGEEAASLVLRQLTERDVEALSGELAGLESVEPEVAHGVLLEIAAAGEKTPAITGGSAYVRQILRRTFNEEQCQKIFERIPAMTQKTSASLEGLRSADPQLLATVLQDEHPQAIALILAQFESAQASAILAKLPRETASDVLSRVAQLKQFSPESAQAVSEVLQSKLPSQGDRPRQTYAGLKSAADILNRMTAINSAPLLEVLDKDHPTVAIGIRNLMFTFEDLLTVPETSIREWLTAIDKKTLALALKGASEEVRNYILKGMSSRAGQMLKEDIEALGPVRGKEIAKAQEEAIVVARQLESEGRLVLRPDGDDEYVV
jgi:flagellar motor switch protein FliG